jgi:hypothetical protein
MGNIAVSDVTKISFYFNEPINGNGETRYGKNPAAGDERNYEAI